MSKRQASKICSIALVTALSLSPVQPTFGNDSYNPISNTIEDKSLYKTLTEKLKGLDTEKPFSLSEKLREDILTTCLNDTEELEHRVIETLTVSIQNFYTNDQYESESANQLDKRLNEINRELRVIGDIQTNIEENEECLSNYPEVYSTHSQRFSRMRLTLEKAFFNYYKSALEFKARFEYSQNKQSNLKEFPENFWRYNI